MKLLLYDHKHYLNSTFIIIIQVYVLVNDTILKIILLLLNLANTIIEQILSLIPIDSVLRSKISVSAFAVTTGLYIVCSFIIIFAVIYYRKEFSRTKTKLDIIVALLTHVLSLIAGTAFLIGDDITPLIRNLSEQLKCDEQCLETVEDVGTVLLIIAILLFRLTPSFTTKIQLLGDEVSAEKLRKQSLSSWSNIAFSFSIIVELDAWFSTVANLPLQSEFFCPMHELALTWILYSASLIIFAILLAVILSPSISYALKTNKKKLTSVALPSVVIILMWSFSALLLVGENTQPLGCLFQCDITTDNSTNTSCKPEAYHGTRVAILALCMFYFGGVFLVLVDYWLHKPKRDPTERETQCNQNHNQNPLQEENEVELSALRNFEEKSSSTDLTNEYISTNNEEATNNTEQVENVKLTIERNTNEASNTGQIQRTDSSVINNNEEEVDNIGLIPEAESNNNEEDTRQIQETDSSIINNNEEEVDNIGLIPEAESNNNEEDTRQIQETDSSIINNNEEEVDNIGLIPEAESNNNEEDTRQIQETDSSIINNNEEEVDNIGLIPEAESNNNEEGN